jgi:hypothetical protein
MAAGATPGSPQLDSFGPNLTLAKELFEKSQPDVILHYFALCKNFWEDGGRSSMNGAPPSVGAKCPISDAT